MDIRTVAALVTLAMLTGCATAVSWNHPTKDEEQFTQERYDCIKDGEQHAANLGYNGNPTIVADRARECMAVKGYTYTKAPKKTATPALALVPAEGPKSVASDGEGL